MEAIINKLGGEEGVAKFLRGEVELVVTKVINFITHTFTVLVNETLSVEKAVKEGKFDWVNDDIVSDNFPKLKDGKKSEKDVVLFHFNKDMSSEAVIAEMDKVGYKPASIWDLLGLAVKEPNLQREFPIVALGSVCKVDGHRDGPYLYRDSDGRYLDLHCFGDDWHDDDRFAGVRK